MATRDELQKAIDAFVAARKSIAGVGEGYNWGPGYSPVERKAVFPIEVNGELVEGARFELVGFPNRQS
jgi:hypothetical protein